MKKGQMTVIITVGAMCFVLVSTMFIQFNTIKKTDIANIKTMRETELKAQLATWNTKYEELEKKYQEVLQKKEEYSTSIGTNEKTSTLLKTELDETNMLLGLTDVVGDGVIVTLTDNEEKRIEAYDILELVNELRLAGAEAISVNNERIISNSDIVDVNNSFIVINGDKRNSSPYIVKAIGNQTYLESGLTAKQYGYMDNVIKGYGKTATIEKASNIKIGKFQGTMSLNYVNKENKENKGK